jgi:hypothetical protein
MLARVENPMSPSAASYRNVGKNRLVSPVAYVSRLTWFLSVALPIVAPVVAPATPTTRAFACAIEDASFRNGMLHWGARIEESGGFCCQVPPNPACRSLTRQDFKSVFQTALRSLSNRSIVVVGNYEKGPITAEPCRAKTRPLRPRRSYFGPAATHPFGSTAIDLGSGGAAGYCPRVRWVYYDGHLSP